MSTVLSTYSHAVAVVVGSQDSVAAGSDIVFSIVMSVVKGASVLVSVNSYASKLLSFPSTSGCRKCMDNLNHIQLSRPSMSTYSRNVLSEVSKSHQVRFLMALIL